MLWWSHSGLGKTIIEFIIFFQAYFLTNIHYVRLSPFNFFETKILITLIFFKFNKSQINITNVETTMISQEFKHVSS